MVEYLRENHKIRNNKFKNTDITKNIEPGTWNWELLARNCLCLPREVDEEEYKEDDTDTQCRKSER